MVIVGGQVYTNIGRRKIRNLVQLAFITKCRFTAAVCRSGVMPMQRSCGERFRSLHSDCITVILSHIVSFYTGI